MSNNHEQDDASPAVASFRTMEVLVALLLLMGSAIVIYDSIRLGFGWRDDGPAPGFFPFWVAILLGGSSLINMLAALRDRASGEDVFVTRTAAGRIMAVLGPLALYVLAVQFMGIYVSSAAFIAGFMIVIGRENALRSMLVGLTVPVVMFVLFERWFLVPLPKGPIESLLGLG